MKARIVLRRLLAAVPFRRRIVMLGAALNPAMKSLFLSRVLHAMNGEKFEVRTNLGISSHLSVSVPVIAASPTLLFGRPDHYLGESGVLELAALLAPRCKAFIDVGSHIGYFVFFVWERTKGSVPIYFFEPNPELFAAIDSNVRHNKLTKVTGFRKALGATNGEAEFFLNLSDSLSSSLTEMFATSHEVKRTSVQVETFETFARVNSIQDACVKVDVENAENQFLDGVGGSLDRIRYLIIELLKPAVDSGFVQRMRGLGFESFYINDLTLEHSPDGNFNYRPSQYNWLFCRETPEELKRLLAASPLSVAD